MARWWLPAVVILGVLVYTLSRDIRFEKAYTGDLRNRVTGARLVRDGRSPYFYKWAPGDGVRYYDPANFDSVLPSNMTSTPILYRLLSPLADKPQSTISASWLAIEYLLLAAITFLAFRRAQTPLQQRAVLAVFVLVLFSNGWEEHVASGQTYLLIPLFAMLFLVFLERSQGPLWEVAAGLAAVAIVGIRPNTLLFFVPFLFLVRSYPRRSLLFFCAPILLTMGWILASGHERGLWKDYFHNVQEAVKTNQHLDPPVVVHAPDPHYPQWEGLDTARINYYMCRLPDVIHSENGNVFVLVRGVFHQDLSVAALGWLAIGIILVLAGAYFLLHDPPGDAEPARAAIFGVCLFMIADLFSPIYRHQYYTVQWIPPLMLVAAQLPARMRTAHWLLLAGLLLWCVHLPFIKMQQTLAEYGIMAVLLGFALVPGRRKASKSGPASLPKSR